MTSERARPFRKCAVLESFRRASSALAADSAASNFEAADELLKLGVRQSIESEMDRLVHRAIGRFGLTPTSAAFQDKHRALINRLDFIADLVPAIVVLSWRAIGEPRHRADRLHQERRAAGFDLVLVVFTERLWIDSDPLGDRRLDDPASDHDAHAVSRLLGRNMLGLAAVPRALRRWLLCFALGHRLRPVCCLGGLCATEPCRASIAKGRPCEGAAKTGKLRWSAKLTGMLSISPTGEPQQAPDLAFLRLTPMPTLPGWSSARCGNLFLAGQSRP